MEDTIIYAKNLSKVFGDKIVLNNLSLSLERGEFVSLIGTSGCGKTILLKVLSGLTEKTSGAIDYNFTTKNNVNISMVFQRAPLFPWLSLIENITICMNNSNLSRKEKHDIAHAYLERARLDKFQDYFPNQISGGMRQKVNIIRSYCSGAEVIFMDEPFVSLDFIQRTELQEFALKIWDEERKTILFVTHNVHEALILSDRIFLMGATSGVIGHEFEIDLPRPRDVEAIRQEKSYMRLLNKINSFLKKEIEHLRDNL
jgi:NitT/TauT family transport system ATP-binding protein